jgi:hypothetical protein
MLVRVSPMFRRLVPASLVPVSNERQSVCGRLVRPLGTEGEARNREGDQRQAGRHGAVSELSEHIVEKRNLAPDVLAFRSEAVDASDIST